VTPNLRSLAGGLIVGSVAAALAAGATAPDPATFPFALGALTVAFVLQFSLIGWRAALGDALARRVMRLVMERQMHAMLRPATVAHLEDPHLLDLMDQSRSNSAVGPRVAANALMNQVANRARGLIALAIFAAFDWRLALLMLVAFHWRNRTLATIYRGILPVMWGKTASMRRSDYLRGVAMGPASAKELRVFGLADFTVARLRAAWLEGMEPVWQERRGSGARLLRGNAPALLAGALAFAALAHAALAQEVEVGPLAAYLQTLVVAFNNLGGHPAEPFEATQVEFGAAGLTPLAELETVTTGPRLAFGGTRPADGLPSHELRFEGVSFRYPDRDRDALNGLDLAIPAGRSLAIVGDNGSGKTTLIKLLARLHDPTAGRIVVDGVDLRELDPRAWQRRVAAIFQDFQRYPLSARDNVAFGAVERLSDLSALTEAARRAGALEVVERLPRGWDTILARQYSGGVDLSGGEWQRIALARALFAATAGAGVLVLDEPTAHLDARAEAAFYDNFLDLTHGMTAIVISHRFSTVRRADRIVVLDAGRVVEQGAHDELVQAAGRYAQAFALQAARFADGVRA
jgi:ATP-binding cassette subfamily B protein